MARKLKRKGMNVSDIMDVTCLPKKVIDSFKNNCRNNLVSTVFF